MRAWGVLGLQPAGVLIFSLLTLLFSGAVVLKTRRFCGSFAGKKFFLSHFVTVSWG
jgi:hypothetical protein